MKKAAQREVLPGNTNDRNTQMPFIEKLEKKYGKIGNLWLMDCGVPSEETLRPCARAATDISSGLLAVT